MIVTMSSAAGSIRSSAIILSFSALCDVVGNFVQGYVLSAFFYLLVLRSQHGGPVGDTQRVVDEKSPVAY